MTSGGTRRIPLTLPKPESRLDTAAAFALFLLACAMLAFYLTLTYHAQLNSDSVMKLMLGSEMAHALSLVPAGWNYENDIHLIFPSLLAAPLALFVPPSYVMNAVVDLIAAALLVGAAYWASSAAKIDGSLRLFVPTLLASGMSPDVAEFVFGQSAYSGPLFALFIIVGCCCRHMDAGSTHRFPTHIAVIAAALLLGVSGGPRGLAIYSAPLIVASAAMYVFASADNVQRSRAHQLGLTAILATAAGGISFLLLLKHTHYHAGSLPKVFVLGLDALRNVGVLLNGWLALFGAIPSARLPLDAYSAIPFAVRAVLATMSFFAPLLLLLNWRRVESMALRFILAMHVGILGSIGSVMIFTNIASQQPDGVPRYLSPLLPTALLATVSYASQWATRRTISIARVAWLLSFGILLLSPALLVLPAFSDWRHPSKGMAVNARMGIIDKLKESGVSHGYATYWHANAITALSGGDLKTLPVLVDGGGTLQRQHFMVAERWFNEQLPGDRFFVLIDGVDRNLINFDQLYSLVGTPITTVHANGIEGQIFSAEHEKQLGFQLRAIDMPVEHSPETCRADYRSDMDSIALKPGRFATVRFWAKNVSTSTWQPSRSLRPGMVVVDNAGNNVSETRVMLTASVTPGSEVPVDFSLKVPATGEYTLKFSFVIEGYAWCGDNGATWAHTHLSARD